MQELEKILEEIGELRGQAGSECTSEDHYIKKAWEHCLDRVVGIIRKHMSGKDTDVHTNDGWISVEKFGLPHSNEHDFRFWVTIQYTNGFRHTIKAKWDCFDKCFIHQNGKKILQDVIAYKYYSAPEPYRPERSEE